MRQRVVTAGGCAPAHMRSPPPLGAESANGSMMEVEGETSVTESGANLQLQSTAGTDPTSSQSQDIATHSAQALLTMTQAGRGQKLQKTKSQRRRERASRLHGET